MNERAHRPDGRIAWMLLCQSTLRHWCEAKWSYLLILGIVAIGVGSLNGIRQAGRAATANFGLFNEAVSGRSEFLIEAPAGPLNASQLFELSETARSLDWRFVAGRGGAASNWMAAANRYASSAWWAWISSL